MKAGLVGLGLISAAVLLAGCGGGGGGNGGGGGPTDTFARPKVSIAWGPRSRAIAGPSSALSAVILLRNASRTGSDVSYAVDRSGPVGGSTVVYTGSEEIKVTPTTLVVRFYSQAGGGGDLVGTASANVPVGADGTITTSVATEGVIQNVEIPAGQSLTVGERRALTFGAHDDAHNLVAVSPGSATWAIAEGMDKLTFSEGEATGVAFGDAKVTATVDGKTSVPTTVSVVNPGAITVAVSPTALSLSPSGTQQFTSDVQGTPNRAVTWSVVEANGGTISATGLYTAPATPGTYTVKATSAANPEKSATATVQVENVQVTINPATTTLGKRGTFQFTGTVTGTVNQNVTWSVVETGGGTVSPTGLYTAPDTAGTYTVRVVSNANTAAFAQATVLVEEGTFTVIGRIGGFENGFAQVGSVSVLSYDGSTVAGSLRAGADDIAGYWTKESGWVALSADANIRNTSVTAISADGTYMAGHGDNRPTIANRAYRWHRNGSRERVRSSHPDGTDPFPTAMSDDGQAVFSEQWQYGFDSLRWTSSPTGLSTVVVGQFDVGSVSADAQTLGGFRRQSNWNPATALWSQGEWTVIKEWANQPVKFLSADASAAASREYYWTRSGGIKSFGEGSSIQSMSRNGKYVVYYQNGEAYVWSEAKGAVTLQSLLESAGAPKGVVYAGGAQLISADGKVFAGSYGVTQPNGSMVYYAYHCRLPAAP